MLGEVEEREIEDVLVGKAAGLAKKCEPFLSHTKRWDGRGWVAGKRGRCQVGFFFEGGKFRPSAENVTLMST